MSHKQRLSGWLVFAIATGCVLPPALRLGTSCANMYMEWCNAQPRSQLSATEARIDQLLQPQRAVPLNTLALSSRLVPLIGLVTLALCLWTMAGITS